MDESESEHKARTIIWPREPWPTGKSVSDAENAVQDREVRLQWWRSIDRIGLLLCPHARGYLEVLNNRNKYGGRLYIEGGFIQVNILIGLEVNELVLTTITRHLLLLTAFGMLLDQGNLHLPKLAFAVMPVGRQPDGDQKEPEGQYGAQRAHKWVKGTNRPMGNKVCQ